MKVNIQKLNDRALIPEYQTEGAAGADLHACIEETMIIEPGKIGLVPTGLAVELEPGYEMQVRPRSGLAAKLGITVLNTPGTIDSDFRGELKVILINLGEEPFQINHGDRIAQMVIASYITAEFQTIEKLSPTKRGEGGYGSTGK